MREQRGVSQYRLAKETGVPQGRISSIERGETKNPTVKTLALLASWFGCTIDDLLDADKHVNAG